MKKSLKISSILFFLLLVSNPILLITVDGCKDIIAVGEATKGEVNLLLKVRDPQANMEVDEDLPF